LNKTPHTSGLALVELLANRTRLGHGARQRVINGNPHRWRRRQRETLVHSSVAIEAGVGVIAYATAPGCQLSPATGGLNQSTHSSVAWPPIYAGRAAGLACDRGVIVDDCSRTSDPAIFAAGDCTARRIVDGALLPRPNCGGRHPLYSAANSLAVNSCAAIAIVPAAVLLMGM
jgi:hypothetical protein